jgi:hypothetical protein
VQATLAHLGPRAVNKLTHKQAADIYNYATLMAGALALALDEPNGEYADLVTADTFMRAMVARAGKDDIGTPPLADAPYGLAKLAGNH